MTALFWRALLAFLMLPAVVAGLVPWLLVRPVAAPVYPAGVVLLALGAVLLLWCVRDFYAAGKGTLAPWDPPKKLVSVGLYRYSRNPMYVAVLLILTGWAITFASRTLAMYAVFMAVVFHLRVILFEEPQLERLHGEAWPRYKSSVRRWLGRLALALCVLPAPLGAQLREIDIVSCPAADSVLGPQSKRIKGRISVFRQDAENVTHLSVTISPRKTTRFITTVRLYGERPAANPELQLSVMNRQGAGLRLREMAGEPSVTIVLDSTALEPAQVRKGRYDAPSNAPASLLNVPLSLLLEADQFIELARARKAVVKIAGVQDVKLTRDELEDLQHLYRAAVCPAA